MTPTAAVAADRPVDRYPSRTGAVPSITARLDPVVWGSDAGPLGNDDLIRYEADGYLHFPAVFAPDEVDGLNAEIDRLAHDRTVIESERVIVEPGSNAVRSVFAVHDDGPLGRLCSDGRLTAIARQILGSEVYIHQSRVNLKPGFRGKEFYWHSDFETWHTEDGMPAMRALSCSVSLTENTTENGPLLVIAGSHHRFASCGGQTPPDHHRMSLRAQEIGVPSDDQLAALADKGEIRALVGPPGSVTFFDCNLMHGSNGNITPMPRRNAFFVFNSVENALGEPFAAPSPRPAFLATRQAAPLPH